MTTNLSTRRIIVTDFSAFYLQDGGEKRREMGHSPHRYETKLRHCHAMYMASGAGATCLVAEGSVGSGHYRPATLANVNFSLCMLWMAPYWVTRARVCVGGPALRRLSLSLPWPWRLRHDTQMHRNGTGTFRTPLLFTGRKRFVCLARRGAGRRTEVGLMYMLRPCNFIFVFICFN